MTVTAQDVIIIVQHEPVPLWVKILVVATQVLVLTAATVALIKIWRSW